MSPTNNSEQKQPQETQTPHAIHSSLAWRSLEKLTLERRQSLSSLSQNSTPIFAQEERHASTSEIKNTGTGYSLSNPNLLSPALVAQAGANTTASSSTPGASQTGVTGPSVINKQLLSKLNKSLKEKQKTTSIRESQTKTPTLIQSVLPTSPQYTTGPSVPGNATSSNMDQNSTMGPASVDEHSKTEVVDADLLSVSSSAQVLGKDTANKSKARVKGKKIAKQSSTRTDFFAAKLASAVDDVESSDSDETFVYETNAHEFGTGSNDDPAVSSSAAHANPSTLLQREKNANGHSENINNAPVSIQIVNDNISVSGSLKNAPFETNSNSPWTVHRRDDDRDISSYVPSLLASRAESIHSVQSSKPHLRNSFHATPPTTTSGRGHILQATSQQNDYHTFSDPYLDTHMRHPVRKSSSHSILSDERKDHILSSPQSPYASHKSSEKANFVSYGLSEHSQSLNRPYEEGVYAYAEDLGSGEDDSSHGDIHMICTDHHVHAPLVSHGNKGSESMVAGCKTRSDKPSTTSSKLRSTTSKLFDKKGAQPRRYSTIPDDIDIEDFDDELIYYDNNNMRFPHNNHQGSLNENTSLLNGHKLPHHRSLNLNFNGKRAAAHPRNTRYVSLGYTPQGSYGGNKKNDVFPFPYPENHQTSFYGFDEYDEENHMQAETESVHLKGRAGLSPSNTRFMLPRKVSHENVGGESLRIVKSVIYTLIGIICILSVGFVLGFLLASTKDLTDVSLVSINHATVSQDELVFNVVIEALNPGWFTVSLEDLELDIFAKSGYLGEKGASVSVETVLLGTVLSFESALRFEGGFFNREITQQTGEIKLKAPGTNSTGSRSPEAMSSQDFDPSWNESQQPGELPDNRDKWAIISKHPFDLILRGVIKYNLPWSSSVKSVIVNKVGYIDPSLAI